MKLMMEHGMKLMISPDLVTALMAALPAEARAPSSGLAYDGDTLVVPERWSAAVSALTSGKSALRDLPLVAAREAARARIVVLADAISARITARYPAAEVASWPVQEAEARAVAGGADAASAPMLAAMAEAAGVSLADYAAAVTAKARAYREVVVRIKSLRDRIEAAIDAATTPDDIATALLAAAVEAEGGAP